MIPSPSRVSLSPDRGDVMGKEARTALILSATACLLAVMVDWVVEELNKVEESRRGS
jgi:hypothetical protein